MVARRSNGGAEGARRFREIRSREVGVEVARGGVGWLGSALRRSSLDEEVVCGGQAWPAYQIRGVFWSCSRYGVLAFQESDLPTSLPSSLLLLLFFSCLSVSYILLVRKLPLSRMGGVVLIGLRGDTH